jgi:hypothetical protein
MTDPVYMPILRVLAAEMDGLRHCDLWTRRHICPLFRIVRARSELATETHLHRAIRDISQCWPAGFPAYLEIEDMPEIGNLTVDHPTSLVHRALESCGHSLSPVVPSHSSSDLLHAVAQIRRRTKSAVGVRIYADDLDDVLELQSRLRMIGRDVESPMSDVHAIVDLGSLRPDTMMVLRDKLLQFVQVMGESGLGRMTIAGCSIPESLDRRFPKDSLRELIKFECQLWRYVARRTQFPIGMGDHLVVRSDYIDLPGPFNNMHGKLFYAVRDRIAVCRGRSRAKERLESQHKRLALMLTNSKYFLGEHFSWGDRQIALLARGDKQVGMPRRMLEIGVSHHLKQVTTQFVEEAEALL